MGLFSGKILSCCDSFGFQRCFPFLTFFGWISFVYILKFRDNFCNITSFVIMPKYVGSVSGLSIEKDVVVCRK
jgi:hypothetical protein